MEEQLCISRAERKYHIMENPSELKERTLLTSSDVLRFFIKVRYDIFDNTASRQGPSVKEIPPIVAQGVLDIWRKTSIPTLSLKSVINKIKILNERYVKVKAYGGTRRESPLFKQKVEQFYILQIFPGRN